MTIVSAIEVRPRAATGDDRVAIVETSSGVIVVVADGAGGTSGGAAAAQAVIDAIAENVTTTPTWVSVLDSLDERLTVRGGQTTAVVVQIGDDAIVGASSVIRAHGWSVRTRSKS